MPVPNKIIWPSDRAALCNLGRARVAAFCRLNDIEVPQVHVVPRQVWHFGACAFYRPNDKRYNRFYAHSYMRQEGYGPGINICLEECQVPCGAENSRNWTWPAGVIDREPYGVLCHELGHHCDYLAGEQKWEYGSEYSEKVMTESGEPKLTNYCPNPAEWFAEMFRLFVTNPMLLAELRPHTFAILTRRWKPIKSPWRVALGSNVPPRVVKSLINKGAV